MWSTSKTIKGLVNELTEKEKKAAAIDNKPYKQEACNHTEINNAGYIPNEITVKYTGILKKMNQLKIILTVVFVISNLLTLSVFFLVERMAAKQENATTTNGLTITLGVLAVINSVVPTATTMAMLR